MQLIYISLLAEERKERIERLKSVFAYLITNRLKME